MQDSKNLRYMLHIFVEIKQVIIRSFPMCKNCFEIYVDKRETAVHTITIVIENY